MDGREVFRFAARVVDKATREVVEQAGLTLDDIELFVPHQANVRIIQAAARALEVDESRIFVNLEKYGNTSSASVPLALCEAVECGRIRPGDHLVLIGFGAGLAWAAAVVQWGRRPSRASAPCANRRCVSRSIPLRWPARECCASGTGLNRACLVRPSRRASTRMARRRSESGWRSLNGYANG